VQGADLHGLVDLRDQRAVRGSGLLGVARGHRGLEVTEVGLDRRGEAAVLEPLSLGAQDPLLL
jgi:hypothetical protein